MINILIYIDSELKLQKIYIQFYNNFEKISKGNNSRLEFKDVDSQNMGYSEFKGKHGTLLCLKNTALFHPSMIRRIKYKM